MRLFGMLLLSASLLFGAHVRWHSDFHAAHQEALQTGKTLMVLLLQSKRDGTAHKMLTTLFMNRPYIQQINSRFVAVLLSSNQTDSYPIEMLYTLTYPTLFFLDAQELFTCKPLRGSFSAAQLKQHLVECR